MPTSALIVIGDEVLTGKVRDENGAFLATRAREIGLDLLRIVVVPDRIPLIEQELLLCKQSFDHVFTSGGVGPTHDDVTIEAVAKTFGLPLVLRPEIAELLRAKMGARFHEGALRMAQVPEGAELMYGGLIAYPTVRVENVWLFPGVPKLFRLQFDGLADRFRGTLVSCARLVTTDDESAIAARLEDAQGRWPEVAIGSYPKFDAKPWTVTITLDSRSREALIACFAALESSLSSGLISREPPPPA